MLGTLTEIGNEDAAGQKAYVLQTDGQWHPVPPAPSRHG